MGFQIFRVRFQDFQQIVCINQLRKSRETGVLCLLHAICAVMKVIIVSLITIILPYTQNFKGGKLHVDHKILILEKKQWLKETMYFNLLIITLQNLQICLL